MDPLTLAVMAFAITAFGLVSGRAERSHFTPPMVFVALGIVGGSAGFHWLDIPEGHEIIHGLAELTLVLVLFTDAARIDLACLRREGSLPARLLALGMPITIVLGGGLAIMMVPGIQPAQAFLLAAILTPTDAALGQAVVSNPLVPLRIRQSLNVESGLNDGIALPVVLILASAAGATAEAGDARYWARFVGLALVLGPLIGAGVGYVGGRLVARATESGFMNDPFQRIAALGLALLAFAGAELCGGNGFIAAFVAGLTVGNTARSVCPCLYEFGEAEGQLLTLLVFVVFGATMVPEALEHWSAGLVLYALVSLTVVRMLPVALSLLGTGLRWQSVAFLGWFGPRGLASILFVLLVVEEDRLAEGPLIEAVVVLTVLMSTILHGMTAYPLARRYGAFAASQADGAEHEETSEMPVRIPHGPSA